MSEPNKDLMKSYVFHGDKCFFVSTIDRNSSAMLGPGRYAETMAWDYNYDARERGELIWQAEGPEGSVHQHQLTCAILFRAGKIGEAEA